MSGHVFALLQGTKKNKVKDRTVKEEEELYLAYCVFNSSRVTSVVISLLFPSTTMKGLIGSPPILQICPGKNYLPSDILLNLYHLRSLFNPSALHYLPHYTECTHIHKSLWWPHVTQVKTSCVHSLRALRAFIQPLIAHILSSQAFIFGFTWSIHSAHRRGNITFWCCCFLASPGCTRAHATAKPQMPEVWFVVWWGRCVCECVCVRE